MRATSTWRPTRMTRSGWLRPSDASTRVGGQFVLVRGGSEVVHGNLGQVVNSGESAKDVLVSPLENFRGRSPALHVWDLVLIWNDLLGLNERRVVAAEQEVDVLVGDQFLDEAAGSSAVAAIVQNNQGDRVLCRPHLESAGFVHIVDRHAVALLEVVAGRAECPAERQDCSDLDLRRRRLPRGCQDERKSTGQNYRCHRPKPLQAHPPSMIVLTIPPHRCQMLSHFRVLSANPHAQLLSAGTSYVFRTWRWCSCSRSVLVWQPTPQHTYQA